MAVRAPGAGPTWSCLRAASPTAAGARRGRTRPGRETAPGSPATSPWPPGPVWSGCRRADSRPVQPHHLLGDAVELRPLRRARGHRRRGSRPDHHRLGVRPRRTRARGRHPRGRRRPAPWPPWPPWTPGSGPACGPAARGSPGPPRPPGPGGTRPSADPAARRTGSGSADACRHNRSSQAWRLYPANSSSPPSPDRATVTRRPGQPADQVHGDLRTRRRTARPRCPTGRG